LSDSTSSTNPVANISPAVMMRTGTAENRPKIAAHENSDVAMATPPNSATGFLCQRSARGVATRPRRTEIIRANGTSASDSARASANGAPIVLIIGWSSILPTGS
jgi:hypothetical protein